MSSSPYVVILVTASSEKEASVIAEELVGARLVACANIVPGIRSIFRWKSEMQAEQEVLLIMKGRSDLFDRIEERVRALHSYEVPEILAIPVLRGSLPYLEWLDKETGGR